MDLLAIKAVLVEMAEQGWPQSRITGANIDALAALLLPYGVEAVTRTAYELANAKLDRDHAFFPTGAEMTKRAGTWKDALDFRDKARAEVAADKLVPVPIGKMPPGLPPAGILDVDFGRGKIDLRGMDPKQVEAVLANKGEVDVIEGGAVQPRLNLKRM